VGTLHASAASSPPFPVHPHPRGDALGKFNPFANCIGSPPPAWGRCNHRRRHSGNLRFTPTRVGTLFGDTDFTTTTAVHPHPRGDAALRHQKQFSNVGSPPPAWGRYLIGSFFLKSGRFTPTRVGTLFQRADFCARHHGSPPPAWGRLVVGNTAALGRTVHPHPRGDARQRVAIPHLELGSPPPAWGRFRATRPRFTTSRFTPTRVGTLE